MPLRAQRLRLLCRKAAANGWSDALCRIIVYLRKKKVSLVVLILLVRK